MVRTTGDIGVRGKTLTITGWCLFCGGDVGEAVMYDEDNEQLVWHGKGGDISISGNNVNGPPLVQPLTTRHLTCRTLSAGSILFIYLR